MLSSLILVGILGALISLAIKFVKAASKEKKTYYRLENNEKRDIFSEKDELKGEYWHKRPLTEIEQKAYWKLLEALGSEKIILSQVAFSSFIRTKGDKEARNSMWHQMRQKVADFVICNKDFSIHCIIEIDDSSHDAEKDKKRDEVLSSAGIKSIRYKAVRLPTVEEIREAIL